MREHRLSQGEKELAFGWAQAVEQESRDASYQIETIAEDRVSEHMSPALQTINQSASLINAARIMCREHIHRLVIVDQEERPLGVVSSLDLVAAMIAAVEE